MPSFKVEELEAVEYDLRPFADSHGKIPEPTEAKIIAFVEKVAAYTGEVLETKKPKSGAKTPKSDEEQGWAMLKGMAKNRPVADAAVAELCSGTPSEEDVAKLPARVFIMFLGYLQESLLSPEALGGDSTPPSPDTASSSTGSSDASTASPSETPTNSPEQSTPSSIAG